MNVGTLINHYRVHKKSLMTMRSLGQRSRSCGDGHRKKNLMNRQLLNTWTT